MQTPKSKSKIIAVCVPVFILLTLLLYAIMSESYITGTYTVETSESYDFPVGEYSDEDKEYISGNYNPYIILLTVRNNSLTDFEYIKVDDIKNEQVILNFSDGVSEYKAGVRPLSSKDYSTTIYINKSIENKEIYSVLESIGISGKLISYKLFSASENSHDINFEKSDGSR